MAITYGDFIFSLRTYIEEETGITTVWRFPGYNRPKDNPFIGIEFVNSVSNSQTKLDELITEDVFINLANYASNVVELYDIQAELNEILRYHTIPLNGTDGSSKGRFNVDRIIATNQIAYGTDVQDETNQHRIYTDFAVGLHHIKKRK